MLGGSFHGSIYPLTEPLPHYLHPMQVNYYMVRVNYSNPLLGEWDRRKDLLKNDLIRRYSMTYAGRHLTAGAQIFG
jgi:hypothetical protein